MVRTIILDSIVVEANHKNTDLSLKAVIETFVFTLNAHKDHLHFSYIYPYVLAIVWPWHLY